MATVFEKAAFTLIVAHGDSMDVKIPGVSSAARVTTGCCSIKDLEFYSSVPGFRCTVDNSTWATRAWTYQEKVLSSRKLYLTPVQAIWRCPEGVVYEDTCLNREAYDAAYTNITELILHDDHTSRFEAYITHLRRYNLLSLSYISDVYNAFAGVITALYPPMHGTRTDVHGLPLADFDAALLWHLEPGTPYMTRTSVGVYLPSWSWSSTVGSFSYMEFHGSLVR
jgi:hypothetical protein